VYMFAGSSPNKTFPRGTNQKSPRTDWLGRLPEVGIEPAPGDTNHDWSIGQIKLSAIPRPATRIIAGDSVQYWLGIYSDARAVISDPVKKAELGMDFLRNTAMQTPDPAFDVTGWVSGHPTRHGGELSHCKANMSDSRQYNAKSNYLFADGHVMTLDYVEARRALQAR
jgi:prepilin-type processing-associated H-X9-DG protein